MGKPKHKKSHYKKVARKHNVTPKEVETEIAAAIMAAYNQPEGSKEKEFFTQLFPSGKLPSNEEFINKMVERVSKDLDEPRR